MTTDYRIIPIRTPGEGDGVATEVPAAVPLHPGTCRKCKFFCEVDEVHMAYLSDDNTVICVRCWRRIAYGEELHMPQRVRRDVEAASGAGG